VALELGFQILAGATDERDREAAKIVDEAKGISTRTVVDEFFVDRIRHEREGTM
jgi:hypothetical protein